MQTQQLALVGTGQLPGPRLWRAWLADRDTTTRFTAKVYRRGEHRCWYWLGALGSDGHGHFRAGSRAHRTSWVVSAHVFAYQQAHGLCLERLLAADTAIRHRCDEASCVNPAHLVAGTRSDNITDYLTRRHRVRGPLGDTRGAAGRGNAIRTAILAAIPHGPDAVEAAIARARSNGDRHAGQLHLFPTRVAHPGKAVDRVGS